MSSKMDEREFFVRRYEGVEPDALWAAVKRALATMELRDADDGERTAQFSTGVSLTSWGESMLATVTADVSDGATLAVRGRPKGSFLTTKTGEDQHARGVEKQIASAIDVELSDAEKT